LHQIFYKRAKLLLSVTSKQHQIQYFMKKKLTLVIDEDVIDRAKRFALRESTTVSDIVEAYLSEHTIAEEDWAPKAGSRLASIVGMVKKTVEHDPGNQLSKYTSANKKDKKSIETDDKAILLKALKRKHD
jgi:hypothetical protein